MKQNGFKKVSIYFAKPVILIPTHCCLYKWMNEICCGPVRDLFICIFQNSQFICMLIKFDILKYYYFWINVCFSLWRPHKYMEWKCNPLGKLNYKLILKATSTKSEQMKQLTEFISSQQCSLFIGALGGLCGTSAIFSPCNFRWLYFDADEENRSKDGQK